MNYGIASAPPLRWLISSDAAVFDAVRAFLADMGRDVVDVAGPPSADDIRRYLHKLAQTVPLPCVRLKLKKVTNATTGELGVEVKCSDRDLDEIVRWQRRASVQRIGTRQ